MSKRPNLVLIMTDTQTKRMVSCYGEPAAKTPALDALAASGVRCEAAYTTCPLCTPARGALFTGLLPSSNGAWANNIAPGQEVAMMGEVFSKLGYRCAYTGKWHLDGGGYFGDGVPGGGFEPDWWYDGHCYAKDLGPEAFAAYTKGDAAAQTAHGLDEEENLWGYRVASRAVDFLNQVGDDEPFVLAVSFDEPHGPHRCPPAYRQQDPTDELSVAPSFGHVPDPEPEMHTLQREDNGLAEQGWEHSRKRRAPIWQCNQWIDTQIDRVIQAIDARFADNTVIVYTTDHGEQQGEHGLLSKGPMMYQESVNIPYIVRVPGGPKGAVCHQPMSHLDLMPTFLDAAGAEIPPILQGRSQWATWQNPAVASRTDVHIQFARFAVNHDGLGGWYPIRCVIADGWKLVLNLDEDIDQLFNLNEDPHELTNCIADPQYQAIRNGLHDRILAEMDRTRDPLRGHRWANRIWRDMGATFQPKGGTRRDRPAGFSWQGQAIEARG